MSSPVACLLYIMCFAHYYSSPAISHIDLMIVGAILKREKFAWICKFMYAWLSCISKPPKVAWLVTNKTTNNLGQNYYWCFKSRCVTFHYFMVYGNFNISMETLMVSAVLQ